MAERYTRVFSLPGQFYCPGSPVVIEAGALLKDAQTGKIIAQVKFRNISPAVIRALTVRIEARDTSGAAVAGVPSFQYLDLSVDRDKEFGTKIPIILPDATTRAFSCICVSAVFTDGTIWNYDQCEDWAMLPTPVLLENEVGAALAEQYRRDTNTKSAYMPADHEDLWYCGCGIINRSSEDFCHCCRAKKASLLNACNMDSLRENKEKYDAEIAAQQAATAEKARLQAAKRKKITIITTSGIALLIVLFLLITKVFVPASNYKHATDLLQAGNYLEAEKAFRALSEYKDSITMALECRYQYAQSLLDKKYFEEAYTVLEEISLYKDSPEQIRKSKIQRAQDHIANKEYDAAYVLLSDMKDDTEAQETVLDGKLKEANDYIQKGDFEKGYAILDSLGEGELVNENIYQRAATALSEKDYDLAYTLFSSIDAYKDAKIQAKETKYQKACDFLSKKDYDNANPIFEELGSYKDSKEKAHYHDYQITDSKEAKCAETGYNTYQCTGCQDAYTEKVAELGHSFSGATCTKSSVCTRCSEYERGALGHSTSTGVCSRCSADFRKTYTFTGKGMDAYISHKYVYIPDDFFTGAYTVSVTGNEIVTFGIFDENNKYIDSTWGDSTIYGRKKICYISVESFDYKNTWTMTIAPA